MGKTPAQEVLDDQASQDAELKNIGIVTEKLDEVQTPTVESEEESKDLSEEEEYQANLKDDDEETIPEKKNSNPIKDKFLNRGEKRRQEIDELKSEVNDKFDKISNMLEELKTSGASKQESTDVLQAELDKFATDNNLNDESKKMIAGLASVLEKQIEAKYKPLQDQVSKRDEQEFWRKDAQIFDTNWQATEKELNSLYPNATATQKAEAKKLMDDYAHSEDYGYVEGKHDPYSQSYIMYEKADEFDAILNSPKKKSFDSSRPAPAANDPEDIDWDAPVDNLKEAKRRQEILDKQIGTSETFVMREGRRLK